MTQQSTWQIQLTQAYSQLDRPGYQRAFSIGYFLKEATKYVTTCPQVRGLIVLLVQLYTGIVVDGWVPIFHAAAMDRLIGTSTGTQSVVISLLIRFGLVMFGWIRQLLTCCEQILELLSQCWQSQLLGR